MNFKHAHTANKENIGRHVLVLQEIITDNANAT